jgi:hypothetical protein
LVQLGRPGAQKTKENERKRKKTKENERKRKKTKENENPHGPQRKTKENERKRKKTKENERMRKPRRTALKARPATQAIRTANASVQFRLPQITQIPPGLEDIGNTYANRI